MLANALAPDFCVKDFQHLRAGGFAFAKLPTILATSRTDFFRRFPHLSANHVSGQ
jgi:hypothetical protein